MRVVERTITGTSYCSEISKAARVNAACLRAVGGLEYRHAGERAPVARILFVLGRVHTGIVGNEKHSAASDAGVCEGEQWVSGHVDSDVLHGDERSCTGHARAGGDLESDLLVGGPLSADAGKLREGLQGLSGWRAGIADAHSGTSLPCATRYRFVPGEQFCPHSSPSTSPFACAEFHE